MEVVTTGLMFPEGPVAMPDGCVLVVEIARGTLSRLLADGEVEVVAQPGGGPNGAAIGPDGLHHALLHRTTRIDALGDAGFAIELS